MAGLMLKKHKKPISDINVVPYIDVMLVLLVIFMITAPLLTQGVNVNLPHAKANPLSSQEMPIVVSVDRWGHYYLNVAKQSNHPLSPQALMTEVAAYLQLAKQQHHTQDIYVKGDRDANYGQVVQAMVLLQKAGAEHVGLITQPFMDR